jgi:S1-C subfamily serine protease
MSKKQLLLTFGIGLVILTLAATAGAYLLFIAPMLNRQGAVASQQQQPLQTPVPGAVATQQAIPTIAAAGNGGQASDLAQELGSAGLASLYDELNPGVVSIRIFAEQEGASGVGSGSGFILDEEGHIITNNHIVAQANRIVVIFHNGFEAEAEIVGLDVDSDLAVIQAEALAEGAHPLSLADSDTVDEGDWVIAIGNPLSLGGTMTLGIVSAKGRIIPSGSGRYSIPEAIQTDAAINPGNSGGPLLNLSGEVVGVNAQIATAGPTQSSAGLGFAIPSNFVRRVAPALIEIGSYQWAWIGIEAPPTGVNQLIMEANNLDTQWGAYVNAVADGGPADEAGIQGSTGTEEVRGFDVPVGGDVIVEADGERVRDFADLLSKIVSRGPGDTLELTILRDGERQQVTVTLGMRPTESE